MLCLQSKLRLITGFSILSIFIGVQGAGSYPGEPIHLESSEYENINENRLTLPLNPSWSVASAESTHHVSGSNEVVEHHQAIISQHLDEEPVKIDTRQPSEKNKSREKKPSRSNKLMVRSLSSRAGESATCLICLELMPLDNNPLMSMGLDKKHDIQDIGNHLFESNQYSINNESAGHQHVGIGGNVNKIIKFNNMSLLPCQHFFHTECIKNWFKRDNSCPACRRRINLDLIFDPSPRGIFNHVTSMYLHYEQRLMPSVSERLRVRTFNEAQYWLFLFLYTNHLLLIVSLLIYICLAYIF